MGDIKKEEFTIFNYYKNIIKKEPMFSKEEVDRSFDIVGMLRLFSYDKMNALIANEINDFVLDKWTAYKYYYYGVDKKVFVPFLNMRKEKNEEKDRLTKLAEFLFPEYSKQRIEEVIVILKESLSFINLEELNNKGGVKKNSKEED